jgi:hypothetical protein
MPNRSAPRPGQVAPSAAVGAASAAALNEFVSRLADLILSLETERGERPDDAVLRYVTDAVTAEIRHRRRTIELTRALTVLERDTASIRRPAAAMTAKPADQERAAPVPATGREQKLAAPAPPFAGGITGGTDAEEAFYRVIVAGRVPVHLRCLDGYEIASAIVRDVGAHTLLVETGEGPQLFLKRNVISIVRS